MTHLIFILAYRGKGTAFWGFIPHVHRYVSAFIIGMYVAGFSTIESGVLGALLWYLFIAPDIGTGYACITCDKRKWDIETATFREWWEYPLTLLDRGCRKIANVYLAATTWLTGRLFIYFLPFCALLVCNGASLWLLPGSLLFGLIYYLAGLWCKKIHIGEAIQISEYMLPLLIGVLI